MLSEDRQAAQDTIHDLVIDAIGSVQRVRDGNISPREGAKLLKEVKGSLIEIDTLRRRC